jgi:hypothetical protein
MTGFIIAWGTPKTAYGDPWMKGVYFPFRSFRQWVPGTKNGGILTMMMMMTTIRWNSSALAPRHHFTLQPSFSCCPRLTHVSVPRYSFHLGNLNWEPMGKVCYIEVGCNFKGITFWKRRVAGPLANEPGRMLLHLTQSPALLVSAFSSSQGSRHLGCSISLLSTR